MITPPLPTFVIIGAEKCGTRWLRWNLSKHPDVFAPRTEPQFFNNKNHFEELGPDWYRAEFADWSGEPIVGEATPGYMMLRHHPEVVAARIQATIPDVRLLAILRNPIDRTRSAMVHFIKHERIAPDADLMDLVRATPPARDPLALITGSLYAASLEPFREVFGDQLLVLLQDDVRTDAARVYARALQHVGAAPGFVPPDLDEVVWSNQTSAPRETLTLEDRRELYEFFADDIDALSGMLGRDLDMWRPA